MQSVFTKFEGLNFPSLHFTFHPLTIFLERFFADYFKFFLDLDTGIIPTGVKEFSNGSRVKTRVRDNPFHASAAGFMLESINELIANPVVLEMTVNCSEVADATMID